MDLMTQNDSLEHPPLDYNPQELPRELKRHYIAASEQDIAAMLEAIGKNNVRELFDHLPKNIRFEDAPELPEECISAHPQVSCPRPCTDLLGAAE